MWHLLEPPERRVEIFLEAQCREKFSYAEVGASFAGAPRGYDNDHHRVRLGSGQQVYAAACAALDGWQMFPAPWTRIAPADAPILPGTTVAMVGHIFGLWWLNACRIVYVIDETAPVRRHGFAYGTLPGHVECGEERFSVEWRADDSVWYELRAFSRPRYWLARLAYPIVRRLQRRFVIDSQASMRRAVNRDEDTDGALGSE